MIWQCTACNCWSREEFIYVDEPTCPVCQSKMVHEQKHIRIE
ncbi:cold-inducible protein YdjO-related protein [Alicyclobacillus mengziensis]|nr:cold-inducible protein YdjO-related protein [Alicyclobacillus mengziensis]